jgi:pyruvate kinase
VHQAEHPEKWTDYIRQRVRDFGMEGKIAVLTEGPSAKHPDTNHRMEIIELTQTR